jgi:hypothetical protein
MSFDVRRAVALVCMLGMLAVLSGCSRFHRGEQKCREPAIPAGLSNGDSLAVPPGLDPLDTRGAVVIPALKEPEAPRSARDPCLSAPPAYKIPQP